MNEIYHIKIGMVGAYYPEDWEYVEVNSFNDFINLIRRNSKSEEVVRIYWEDIENILCVEFDEKKE